MANLYISYFPTDRKGSDNFKQNSTLKDDITKSTLTESEAKLLVKIEELSAVQQQVLDDLAYMEFLRRKYYDRTGSVNMLFSRKWVPGTTGTAFIRYPEPGVFVDFYVTQVTHVYDNSGGAGTAITNVSFCSARTGQTSIGVSEHPLYQYSIEDMAQLQNSFIKDLG